MNVRIAILTVALAAGAVAAEKPESLPASPLPAVGEQARVISGFLMQVNGHHYSVDELVDAAGPRLARIPRRLPAAILRDRVTEAVAETMQEKVHRTLVLDEAEKRLTEDLKKGIDEKVQERIKERIAQSGGSRSLFDQKLRAEGSSIQKLEEAYRDQFRIWAFLQKKLSPEVTINRRVLLDYYRRHPEEYTAPKQVQMQIIAAPLAAFARGAATHEAAKAAARQAIDKAAAALAAGKEFAAVAREFSKDAKAAEGGLWPAMPEGSFAEAAVEKAAFALPEGQASGMIETAEGFYIVKAAKVTPAKQTSFADAQADIEEKLHADAFDRLTDQYAKQLMERATILRHDELIPLTIEKAMEAYLAIEAKKK